MDQSADSHNGGDIAWAVFNRQWLNGFLPRMTFLERNEDRTLSLDEACNRYRMGLGKAASERGADLRSLLRTQERDDCIHVSGRTILALVSWKGSSGEGRL